MKFNQCLRGTPKFSQIIISIHSIFKLPRGTSQKVGELPARVVISRFCKAVDPQEPQGQSHRQRELTLSALSMAQVWGDTGALCRASQQNAVTRKPFITLAMLAFPWWLCGMAVLWGLLLLGIPAWVGPLLGVERGLGSSPSLSKTVIWE